MLTLNDGRTELWQWDTGRTLAVDADCSQVHFSNKVFGRSIDVDVNDGVAIIPDILLQTDKELNVWAFVGTAENGYTKISKTFTVNRRNKPADYVFTPTDQTTLDDILDRIEDLEKRPSGGNGGITKEVDPTVPDWAKQPQKPTYTAADVGSIPVPKTATVGQTIRVKAVDDAGVPTEWEAADMPTGVETWEIIDTIMLLPDVTSYILTKVAGWRKIKLTFEKTYKNIGSGNCWLGVYTSNEKNASCLFDSLAIKSAYADAVVNVLGFYQMTLSYGNNIQTANSLYQSLKIAYTADITAASVLRLDVDAKYAEAFDGTGKILVEGVRA